MVEVTPCICIADSEIEMRFLRSPGPGGQHVNKTETAVQLRFNAKDSSSISAAVFRQLRTLAGSRMTRDGVLVITAHRFRSQDQNRQDALDRLVTLIRKASIPPKRRKPTRPSRTAKQRRLDSKRRRSDVKRTRGEVPLD
jgi:ribosome-associated protein